MAEPAVPMYTVDIPSLQDVCPNLDQTLTYLDITRRIHANTPIQLSDLKQARGVAGVLEAALVLSSNPLITKDVVAAAESRVRCIEFAHCSALYAPELMSTLQDIVSQFQRNTAQLQKNTAEIANLRSISYNNQLQHTNVLRALLKVNEGSGRDMALQLAPERLLNHDVHRNYFDLHCPAGQAAAVGTAPVAPIYNPNISHLQDIDILVLIGFYNDNFDIVASDPISTRRSKFRGFLTQF